RPAAADARQLEATLRVRRGGRDHLPCRPIERGEPVVDVHLLASQEICVTGLDRGVHLVPTAIGEAMDAVNSNDGPGDRLAAGVYDSTGDRKIGAEVEVVGVRGLHLPIATALYGWQLLPARTQAGGGAKQGCL